MIKLDEFKLVHLKLNWMTILIGWEGPGKFEPQLTPKEVINFAIDQIGIGNSNNENLITLASCNENETEKIDVLIRKLAQQENVARENELRKWRVLIVKQSIVKIRQEPLYGLIELTELWDKFGFPGDSPHIIQGLRNNLSPIDYYREENFRQIIERHKEWIDYELVFLHDYEKLC
ncbi:MAG: DUF2247 family protein [Firmicutes bacterium]|nr:DUF2247 family protein [Bacillota bacterium]